MLEVLNCTEARKNFKRVLQSAAEQEHTVIITRQSGESAAIISIRRLNELEKALENNRYLEMFHRSENEVKNGAVVTKSLEELEGMVQ